MREYLFRGKSKKTGKWVFGYYRVGAYWKNHMIDSAHGPQSDEVDPETVGQFTGLHDSQGNKIFEGDIVRICCGHEDETTINEVYFDGGEWRAGDIGGDYDSLYNQIENCGHEVEVIGNVFDNKELLNDND